MCFKAVFSGKDFTSKYKTSVWLTVNYNIVKSILKQGNGRYLLNREYIGKVIYIKVYLLIKILRLFCFLNQDTMYGLLISYCFVP